MTKIFWFGVFWFLICQMIKDYSHSNGFLEIKRWIYVNDSSFIPVALCSMTSFFFLLRFRLVSNKPQTTFQFHRCALELLFHVFFLVVNWPCQLNLFWNELFLSWVNISLAQRTKLKHSIMMWTRVTEFWCCFAPPL